MGDSPCPQHAADRDLRVSVVLDCVPVVGEALARAGVPVLAGLTLSGGPVRGARVTATITAAGVALGAPVERVVDVVPGRTTALTDLVLLDPDALAAVRETGTGTVEVRVEHDGELVGRGSAGVRVLAAGHWLAAPSPLGFELLAAHVQPDSPAVAGLVGAAADLLRQRTGDAAVGEPPTAVRRIDETVAAIVEMVRRRAVRPQPTSTSWADVPQRVRTPAEVLEERTGSSLDTTLTLAAALEHAGVRPLVWVAADGGSSPGHAFLGWWRTPCCAASTATTEVSGLVELVHAGEIALVETTMLAHTAEPATFGDLHRTAAAAWLAGDLRRVLGVTDVHRARLDGVAPLPLPGPLTGRRPARDTRPRTDGTTAPLLDLDRRPEAALPLTVPPGRLAALAEGLGADARLTLLPADQLGAAARRRGIRSARDLPPHQLGELLLDHGGVYADVDSAEYARRLGLLADRVREPADGSGELHLALGSVSWEVEGEAVRSPLLLVPVVLTRVASSGAYRLSAAPGGTPGPNGCLLAELRRRTGVALAGLDDGADIDLASALPALRQELAQRGLPFRVEPTADLAVLPAAAHRVRQDAERLGAGALRNPLVPVLLRPGQPFADPGPADVDLAELSATLPLPADTDQLQAIADALAGRTFVLEGAPGTGRTQTVADLLVAAAGQGQRVLVVAAQQASLDAVSQRLQDVARLAADAVPPAADAVPPAADALPADVELSPDTTGEGGLPVVRTSAAVTELRDARRAVADHVARAHDPNSAGLSLAAAYAGVLSAAPDLPTLPLAPAFVATASARTTAAVRHVLSTLPEVADRARPRPGHPWGFVDSADADPVAVQAAAVAVDTALRALPPAGPLARVVAAARTPADLDAVATVLAGPAVPLADLDAVRTPAWADQISDLLADVAAFTTAVHPALEVALPQALDLPLAGIADDARQAATSGRFGRVKRLTAVLAELAPGLDPDAHVEPADVPALVPELVELQATARELALRCSTIAGLAVPWNWNPLVDPGLVERQVAAVRGVAAVLDGAPAFAPPLRRFLDTAPPVDPARAVAVRRLRAALAALPRACDGSLEQLLAWAGEGGLVRQWDATQEERAVEQFGLPSLGHWLDLLRHVHLLDAAGLSEARAALLAGHVPAADALASFDRGVAEASFAERSAAGGRAVEAPEDAVRRSLVASSRARTEAAVRAALPAGTAVPAGCVLATPDAVARLLPPAAGSFDLVVVEDAQSLRVTDVLGALGRGTAAVVVGDGGQLPPRGAPDELPDEGLLAACLRAGVPRRELTWQHAARDEALIAVTSAVAHDGRLRTVPGAPAGPAVSLVRVDGVFQRAGDQRETNPVEARAVVAELRHRFDASPDAAPSVAVVTLHAPQARLVEGLVRADADPRLAAALESGTLAVRDVEQAQDVTADVVLLSLGCSDDEHGRLPLDLGPLSRAGGERRLTVAMTRARRQLVLFASFTPELLRPEVTAQLGVRRLRAHLDLAEHGAPELPWAGGHAPAPDPYREDVAAALRDRGLVARTDVGWSSSRVDLTVARAEAPDQPLLAVLLDGQAWAALHPVDRELTYLELETARGWPAVQRVWLPEWLAERDAVLDRLVATVDGACPPVPLLAPLEMPMPAAEPVIEPLDLDDEDDGPVGEPVRCPAQPVVTPARLPDEELFRPWTPKPVGEPTTLRQLANPEAARLVRRLLTAGVAAEGPIHRERLARLTAAACGVPRVNTARIESILALLPGGDAEFLWPASVDPAAWTAFRRQAASTERALEHVPPQELVNAMVALCRSVAGLTRDELFSQTLAVFGHRRRHPVLMPYLEAALAQAVRADRITRAGSGQLLTAVTEDAASDDLVVPVAALPQVPVATVPQATEAAVPQATAAAVPQATEAAVQQASEIPEAAVPQAPEVHSSPMTDSTAEPTAMEGYGLFGVGGGGVSATTEPADDGTARSQTGDAPDAARHTEARSVPEPRAAVDEPAVG
ncbi:AAA domain-containing protein [uncultured Modestobacter sp.]|uniref:AAA domain-containing protein n=1 Tax=uncultured Modestobacter sp. TaxID=380048 RepID=UPI00263113C3|nr:AAA domain-containing protein [uncultured Modestobacter sp.]